MSNEFQVVFDELKPILAKYANKLDLVVDSNDEYFLNTRHIMKNKKPLYFGSVKINKNYVSYHLMPVYVTPSLLDSCSKELKKQMQGKSCFNFKSVDKGLFKELAKLTKAGVDSYKEQNYL